MVDTEIVPEAWKRAEVPILKAEDVSQCVLYTISTPPHVQVHEITVQPL